MAAHSHSRTHRGKDAGENSTFPGMMITYALMEKLDKIIAEGKGNARLVNKATVKQLIREVRFAHFFLEQKQIERNFDQYICMCSLI